MLQIIKRNDSYLRKLGNSLHHISYSICIKISTYPKLQYSKYDSQQQAEKVIKILHQIDSSHIGSKRQSNNKAEETCCYDKIPSAIWFIIGLTLKMVKPSDWLSEHCEEPNQSIFLLFYLQSKINMPVDLFFETLLVPVDPVDRL